jgi:hypothetical protein
LLGLLKLKVIGILLFYSLGLLSAEDPDLMKKKPKTCKIAKPASDPAPNPTPRSRTGKKK